MPATSPGTPPSRPQSRTRLSLPSDREVAMTREFNAPRQMVFDAWTQPALLKQWWGPPGWTLPVCEIDLRVGGAWRYVMHRASDGIQITMRGIYQEVSPPDRLVTTQRMEGCDGQGDDEALCTLTLTERDGRTTLTSTTRYPSQEIRDRVLKSGGSEAGMDLVFDRLAEVLAQEPPPGGRGQGVG